MEPTTLSNTLATTHPFIVGRRTFARQYEALAFASRTAENLQLATAVRDRRTGNRIMTFPVGVRS